MISARAASTVMLKMHMGTVEEMHMGTWAHGHMGMGMDMERMPHVHVTGPGSHKDFTLVSSFAAPQHRRPQYRCPVQL